MIYVMVVLFMFLSSNSLLWNHLGYLCSLSCNKDIDCRKSSLQIKIFIKLPHHSYLYSLILDFHVKLLHLHSFNIDTMFLYFPILSEITVSITLFLSFNTILFSSSSNNNQIYLIVPSYSPTSWYVNISQ